MVHACAMDIVSTRQAASRDRNPIAACVLAAGRGRRMGGQAKSAIRIGARSILEDLVHALREGGCDHVTVLVGPYADILRPLAARCGARVAEVGRPDGSIVDTQRDAVAHHLQHHPRSDLLITVADLPLLRPAHVQALLSAWRQDGGRHGAMAPMVDGQRGHPVDDVRALARDGAVGGVRGWLQAHPDRLALWLSTDAAFITDVDTPEALASLKRLAPFTDR